MQYANQIKRSCVAYLIASLLITPLSGLGAKAFANPPEQPDSSKQNNMIIGGLLAVGLISLLSSDRDDRQDVPSSNPTLGTSGTQPHSSVQPSPSIPSSSTPAGISSLEQQAVNLLNVDRQAQGLAPLRLNVQVASVARKHARDMISRNFFAHVNPDGLSPFDRMRQAGISFGYAGENLAINTNVAAAEKAFMNSPGHRANILNPKYTEVGIGVQIDSRGSVYVVQNFIGR